MSIDPILDRRYACATDMERVARGRMPGFARDYLAGGLTREDCIRRNDQALRDILLVPRYAVAAPAPDLRVRLLGQTYDAPFGVAPLGLAGLLWPGAEQPIARAARAHNVLHVLSTFSNCSLEEIAPVVGDNGWFQLYVSSAPGMDEDLMARALRAGYRTLVVTVDIPTGARRERDIRNGLVIPPRFGLPTLIDAVRHPRWLLALARSGVPGFGNLAHYYPQSGSLGSAANFIGRVVQGHITPERLARIRAAWPGGLVVKGVLDPRDAVTYRDAGADALVVSNHGGRQLDAAPAAVSMLAAIRRAVGADLPLLVDGGARAGLDVARMLAAGADYVLIGRPFVYAAAAAGARGPDHLIAVLKDELRTTLSQLGCVSLVELRDRLSAELR